MVICKTCCQTEITVYLNVLNVHASCDVIVMTKI